MTKVQGANSKCLRRTGQNGDKLVPRPDDFVPGSQIRSLAVAARRRAARVSKRSPNPHQLRGHNTRRLTAIAGSFTEVHL